MTVVTPIPLHLALDSPIPIRRQLAEQLKRVIANGGVTREQALPSIREMAGFLGINANTVARVIEDLKRSGHVEARRGKGVFVSARPPVRSTESLRDRLLRDVVIRAAAIGMTPDDVAVGVLSLTEVRPDAVTEAVEVLLVECSPAELEFFAREIEAHFPVRVDKVLHQDLAAAVARRPRADRWAAAVTSFFHLPQVERRLGGLGVPVIALLAEVHLETLHQLAQFPSGTRVGVTSPNLETAHNLEHSIANAGLPNITLVGACPAEGAALARLVRRVDVIVCSTAAVDQVRHLARPTTQVLVDDRALDQRAIEMLAAILVRRGEDGASTASPTARRRPPTADRRRRPRAGPAGRAGKTRLG
jgi:DNA-binding transcriptional regulator YhcF (GntR family)